ncbi:unnamed protein product [Thlaspi arvense]|uniref:YDG domain-containing protein n=1 Tax=Thlaspi arvense TaxID=13288 RepID=A0AAU9RNN2_THLAR|nr:unnamed protein product [Thlaspi arvense]
MNHSCKRSFVYAIRDYPNGCGDQSHDLPERSIKNPRTVDAPANIPSNDHAVAAPRPYGTSRLKQEPVFESSVHDLAAAAPRPKVTSFKEEHAAFGNSYHDHVAASSKARGTSLTQEAAARNSDQHDPTTPREKVLEVLRAFKDVFRQLDRDKQARRGGDLSVATDRIDIKTQAVLESMGKSVNTEKRIGSVPGIIVGDVFQYKTELRVVGLHFKTMCGIDYMKVGDVKLATSIVASEGNGYNDKYDAGVMIYTGEGGNVMSKEEKTEDQKLVKGNLALANSMREKSLVRVIRGEERWDRKGKRYVYDGLYLVDRYWVEKEVRGTTVYKFKLCRIPGQPPLT